jgi:hypothetical protein
MMKLIFILGTALIISFCCSFYFTHNANGITAIEVATNYPTNLYEVNGATKVGRLSDTMKIFYYKNYVLYKFQETRSEIQTDGSFKLEEGMNFTGNNPYYFYKKGEKFGWKVLKLSEIGLARKLSVDTFINKEGGRMVLGLQDVNSIGSKISFTDEKTGFFVEQYTPKEKINETTPDSISLFFDKKMNDIEYTFSPVLDSIYKMKLCKIQLLYNEYVSPTYKKIIPKRAFSLQIRKLAVENSDNALAIFKQFIALK